jgi:hypothetical protein
LKGRFFSKNHIFDPIAFKLLSKHEWPSQVAWPLSHEFNKKLIIVCLTSSNFVIDSRNCGILVTKFDVVGLLKSSRVSRTKSLTEITPGILTSFYTFVFGRVLATCSSIQELQAKMRPTLNWVEERKWVSQPKIFRPTISGIFWPQFELKNRQKSGQNLGKKCTEIWFFKTNTEFVTDNKSSFTQSTEYSSTGLVILGFESLKINSKFGCKHLCQHWICLKIVMVMVEVRVWRALQKCQQINFFSVLLSKNEYILGCFNTEWYGTTTTENLLLLAVA